MNNLTLLVADDEEKTRRLMEISLGNKHTILLAESGQKALEYLRSGRIDIVLTDLKMPDVGGAAILAEVREQGHGVPVIIMTAFGTIENAVAMMKEGAFDYIVKPVNLDHLDLAIGRASQHILLVRENQRLRATLQSLQGVSAIVTASPKMQEILESIRQIAPTNFAVLIEGETGTGKELVARSLHDLSTRANGSFVAVNCAAIPRELLESEFFGSERGAFTGATAQRPGKFEQANGGTLFLDEVGELPVDLQVKLLRALEEHAIVRVGGSERILLDVRIIAATNRRMRQEVEAKRFRSDLYYRLNVVNISLPALRERPEDIPLLAQHFIQKHGQAVGKELKGFDERAVIHLKSHSWPGNVRELDNVVIRSMVAARGEYVTIEDLPADLHLGTPGGEDALPVDYQDFLSAKRKFKDRFVKELERNYLLERLRENGWNISQTARTSGMDRRLLHARLKALGLKVESPSDPE